MKFRWDAEDYARNATAQCSWARELIGKLALHGDEQLLDIGCGDGAVSAELATHLPRGSVLGIDASGEMVAAAKRSYSSANAGTPGFRQMDARVICLQERFDVAFSNAALHWVDDHNAVMHGVRRVLKPGGRLLFQMGGDGNAAALFEVLEAVISTPVWRGYFTGFVPPYHFYAVTDYEKWLPENGFEPVRIELIPKMMRHCDSDGLKGWFRTTWFPYTNRLPKGLQEAFIEEVIGCYLSDHPPEDDGTTAVAMVRLEVEASVPKTG